MRLGGYRTSDNVGQASGGGSGGFGGGGGGIFGLVFSLVASRFGIIGIVVLVGGAMLLGINPFGGGGSYVASQPAANSANASEICQADSQRQLSCQVLASTEDVWGKIFQQNGREYTPTALRFYDRSAVSGCGAAQAAMGPFYCPTDKGIYLDTSFYDELANRLGADGDFAEGYVIAHEVGHHIQDLTGTLDQARGLQARASQAEGNAVQVKVELQADCYAGVWAKNAVATDGRALLEPGDVEEGLTAAHQIGDDTLMKSAGQNPVESMFTHGSSEQRMAALKRGLDSGDPQACAVNF